jgi:hypothetical protein
MTDHNDHKQVLALDIRSRSFGFAVFEGSNHLLDWGVKSFRPGVNAVKLPPSKKLLALLDEFNPSAVVIRKPEPGRNRKRAPLLATIQRVAKYRRIPLRLVPSRAVKRTFAGAERSRYEIAIAVAQRLSELATRLPPKRKIWESEDYRMSIFDATAIGVAYFARYGKRSPTGSRNPTPSQST